ncbi:MAG TPA: 2-dehydropantoate 2-reductase N-terminal domain-containing protein [Actinomycetota bacterium]|nr:2-dehydropantoate 2-reductase N-terminal domain-containing protein [Actinomycetota bacterium]
MRFVIYGAGGIGGVLGARLHQNEQDVLLIARGAHFEAIADRGLRLQTPDEDVTLKIPVVEHPGAIQWRHDDVVFLAMKSQDTLDALVTLRGVAPQTITLVSLQNGVANERAAIRFFPNVYGICVMCPTQYLEAGTVQANSAPVTGIFDIGRYPDGVDDVAVAISDVLARSTYVSEPRPDIMRWKYGKLLMNLGNGIDAMCGPAARGTDLYRIVRDEGAATLRAAGIDFVDSEEDAARRGSHMSFRPIEGQRRGGGSTWQSLERGLRSVETDYFNGEIVSIGRLHGIPTPVNELVQRLTAQAARAGTPAGSVPPERLLDAIWESAAV